MLCTLCLILGSCSSTTFVYNRLNLVLPWYLERYVDLDRAQSQQLDEALGPLLSWHRREELPRYVAFLDTLDRELDQVWSAEILDGYADTMELAWYRVRDRALDELLELGESLDEGQIDGFVGALEKKQRKYERKYLERSDRVFREDAFDNLCDAIEDYLGRLDAPQRAVLRQTADSLRRSDDVWLRERASWVSALRLELQRNPGWQQRIRTTVQDWEAQLDAATLELYDYNTALVLAAVAKVMNTRSERQDQRLRRELRDLREDLTLLAAQAPALPVGQENSVSAR